MEYDFIAHTAAGTPQWQCIRLKWYGIWLALGDDTVESPLRLYECGNGYGEQGFGCMDHRHDAAMYRHAQCQLAGRDTLADQLAVELGEG